MQEKNRIAEIEEINKKRLKMEKNIDVNKILE